MTAIIIDCDQGSPEWFKARAGKPSASEFHTILAKGKDGGASVTRRTYLHRLAGEIITGEPAESYTNPFMERGKAMEAEARDFYAFMADVEPRRVGLIVNQGRGCSPDALIGDAGMLEIKTRAAHLQIECLLKDQFPPEHKAQCQGALWVAERDWIDLIVYWPGLPPLIKRAGRDEEYIAKLASAVSAFEEELHATVERVRALAGRSNLKAQLAASVAAEPNYLLAG